MNDWEAEKQREHQRNVAIIIVVFFGLLYLSYKFDDDPPFKKHPPVNQSPSKGLPITPTGISSLA